MDRKTYDVRIEEHSNASQRVAGKYVDGATREEVAREHKGSWGGRFESFGNGEFVYIASTD